MRPLGLPLSLSHEILPEFREYERAATVTLNAYLAPRMQSYLRELSKKMKAHGAGLKVMQSSGGILSAEAAAREPVRTILSGPAGGAIGALSVSRRAGIARLLSFDMGGTSTDVALLDAEREPTTSVEGEVAGYPCACPCLTFTPREQAAIVGMDRCGGRPAGGTAIVGRRSGACVLRTRRPRYGHRCECSAGPAASGHFLGGAMRLDAARARSAVEHIRRVGGFASVEAAAEGMILVANARMESALRRVSVERGFDPRAFALLGFGGAGPLHACALA